MFSLKMAAKSRNMSLWILNKKINSYVGLYFITKTEGWLDFQILRRNCLLQRVIEGKIKGGIEVTGRRGRRCKKLLDDLKGRSGYSHLKEEAIHRTMWGARFGRGFGPVVRQTTEWMKYLYTICQCGAAVRLFICDVNVVSLSIAVPQAVIYTMV
jgi:hypothetical protein